MEGCERRALVSIRKRVERGGDRFGDSLDGEVENGLGKLLERMVGRSLLGKGRWNI